VPFNQCYICCRKQQQQKARIKKVKQRFNFPETSWEIPKPIEAKASCRIENPIVRSASFTTNNSKCWNLDNAQIEKYFMLTFCFILYILGLVNSQNQHALAVTL